VNWFKRTAVALPLVALAVAAFGTSSASASTVLCSTNETKCSAAHTLKAGSYVRGIVDKGYEGTEFWVGLFACDHLALGGKTTAEFGNPLPMQGESWMSSYECHGLFGGGCSEAKATQPPARITAGAFGSGTIAYGTSSEHMSFTFTCTLGLKNPTTCKFGTSNLPFTFNAATQLFSVSGKYVTVESASGEEATTWCGKVGETTNIQAKVGNIDSNVFLTSN
jgi:hypothetical protein